MRNPAKPFWCLQVFGILCRHRRVDVIRDSMPFVFWESPIDSSRDINLYLISKTLRYISNALLPALRVEREWERMIERNCFRSKVNLHFSFKEWDALTSEFQVRLERLFWHEKKMEDCGKPRHEVCSKWYPPSIVVLLVLVLLHIHSISIQTSFSSWLMGAVSLGRLGSFVMLLLAFVFSLCVSL